MGNYNRKERTSSSAHSSIRKAIMAEQEAGNQDYDGLTKEEDAKCYEAFSAFDKDSSGKIDANELRIVLEMMGQKTTEEEIFRMIAEADAESTGEISYSQFRHVI